MARTSQGKIIDTNVLVDYLRNLPQAGDFLNSLDNRAVSSITAMEVIQGSRNKKELEINSTFLSNFEIVEITEDISSKALTLMKNYNLEYDLQVPDALIAATAMNQGKVLATRNKKDFEVIKGLEVYQPYN